jgi:sirohydrochlorin ferrochelatase
VASEPRIGLIVFAHGSRVPEANEGVRRAAGAAAECCGIDLWDAAFLELAEPTLESAVDQLTNRGADKIIVTPYFLTMGIHLQRDLPELLRVIVTKRPGLDISQSAPFEGHPLLVDILADRAREFMQP